MSSPQCADLGSMLRVQRVSIRTMRVPFLMISEHHRFILPPDGRGGAWGNDTIRIAGNIRSQSIRPDHPRKRKLPPHPARSNRDFLNRAGDRVLRVNHDGRPGGLLHVLSPMRCESLVQRLSAVIQ